MIHSIRRKALSITQTIRKTVFSRRVAQTFQERMGFALVPRGSVSLVSTGILASSVGLERRIALRAFPNKGSERLPLDPSCGPTGPSRGAASPSGRRALSAASGRGHEPSADQLRPKVQRSLFRVEAIRRPNHSNISQR